MSGWQQDPEVLRLLDYKPEVGANYHQGGFGGGGAYEGAGRTDNAVSLWNARLNSADRDILPDKHRADARVRDMLRNDAYVQGGAALHRDNIVGSMFTLNSKPDWKVLGLDEDWAEEFQAEVEAKFTLWAESPNHWMDAARMNTLTSMTRLVVGVYVMAGEVLASAEWMRSGSRPFQTAIQMIDLDRLSNPYGKIEGPDLRGGVQRDKYGAPIGYHIRMSHPTDFTYSNRHDWKYVAARKPWGRMQMIHIVEQMRPDQTRGISEMVAALKEMRITKKYRDIVLQNAVATSTYAASIESDLPSEHIMAALGGGETDPFKNVENYMTSYLRTVDAYSGAARNLHIDGVKIPHLPPGSKLQLRNAGTPGGIGTDFEASLLRYISANLGVSYEQLSHDYSNVNYSSVRAAMNETWKYMQSRKRMVADRFASSVFRLWLEEAINLGEIESVKGNAPSFYEGLNADAYTACEWIGASRGQVDELKETQAAVLRLKYHLTTQEDEMSRMGKDWRKVFVQREREVKEMKDRGLVVEEADSINAASGDPREKDGDAGVPPSEDEQTEQRPSRSKKKAA